MPGGIASTHGRLGAPDLRPLPVVQEWVLGPALQPVTGGQRPGETSNDAGQRDQPHRRRTLLVSSHPNKGWVLWTADASSNATTTGVSAGQSVCGAPRRNRTGD